MLWLTNTLCGALCIGSVVQNKYLLLWLRSLQRQHLSAFKLSCQTARCQCRSRRAQHQLVPSYCRTTGQQDVRKYRAVRKYCMHSKPAVEFASSVLCGLGTWTAHTTIAPTCTDGGLMGDDEIRDALGDVVFPKPCADM